MKKLILFYLIIISNLAFSQKWHEKTKAYTSIGTILGTDSLAPFLIRSNQYGTLQNTSNFIYFSGGFNKQYDSLYTYQKKLKRFGLGYGLETQINIGKLQDIRIPEAYIKIRYGVFEFYGGRRREIQGLVDTLGTMGSYIWSGNAIPVPKVEICIPSYSPIIGNGLISIKGNFAHGWFGNADSVKNYWLHQKSLYVRLGRPKWKIKFYGGFNHQVQWGGRPTKAFYDEISNQTISKFGTDFSTFLKMATGISLASGPNDWTGQTGVAANEAGNRTGNHLGTVDLGLDFLIDKAKVLIYRQSIYEDGSLYYLNNIKDGLNGCSIRINESRILKAICIEYLNTSSQGGQSFNNIKPELRGRDNYFNNSIYKDAWTYKTNTIGNPLLTPYNLKNIDYNRSPIYNNNYIINNRIKATHYKVEYTIYKIWFKTEIINSMNQGTYSKALNNLKSTSVSQQLLFLYKKNSISTKLAFDNGQYWRKNVGLMLNIKRSW